MSRAWLIQQKRRHSYTEIKVLLKTTEPSEQWLFIGKYNYRIFRSIRRTFFPPSFGSCGLYIGARYSPENTVSIVHYTPLQWASSCEDELTVTLHVEQWRCFLQLLGSSASPTSCLLSGGFSCGPDPVAVAVVSASSGWLSVAGLQLCGPEQICGDIWRVQKEEESAEEGCE